MPELSARKTQPSFSLALSHRFERTKRERERVARKRESGTGEEKERGERGWQRERTSGRRLKEFVSHGRVCVSLRFKGLVRVRGEPP